MRDFDTRKRRGARVAGEPAWRKLERKLEERRTRGLLSDFEDYTVDESGAGDGSDAKKERRSASRRRLKGTRPF
jgi:N-glycosylase/DNA lyase